MIDRCLQELRREAASLCIFVGTHNGKEETVIGIHRLIQPSGMLGSLKYVQRAAAEIVQAIGSPRQIRQGIVTDKLLRYRIETAGGDDIAWQRRPAEGAVTRRRNRRWIVNLVL